MRHHKMRLLSTLQLLCSFAAAADPFAGAASEQEAIAKLEAAEFR